ITGSTTPWWRGSERAATTERRARCSRAFARSISRATPYDTGVVGVLVAFRPCLKGAPQSKAAPRDAPMCIRSDTRLAELAGQVASEYRAEQALGGGTEVC